MWETCFFLVFFTAPHSWEDLSSPTWAWTWGPAVEARSLIHYSFLRNTISRASFETARCNMPLGPDRRIYYGWMLLLNTEPLLPAEARRKLTFKLPLVVKARPHMLHTKGFSPVWVRSWIWSALADEKFFPHLVQPCCLACRRGWAASKGVIPGDMVAGPTNPPGTSTFT